ncbi:hypothetical protein ACSS6W_007209 [Trichoderma asperelloides]
MHSVGRKSSNWQLTKNSMHEFASPTAQRKYFGSSLGIEKRGRRPEILQGRGNQASQVMVL